MAQFAQKMTYLSPVMSTQCKGCNAIIKRSGLYQHIKKSHNPQCELCRSKLDDGILLPNNDGDMAASAAHGTIMQCQSGCTSDEKCTDLALQLVRVRDKHGRRLMPLRILTNTNGKSMQLWTEVLTTMTTMMRTMRTRMKTKTRTRMRMKTKTTTSQRTRWTHRSPKTNIASNHLGHL